MHQISSSFLVAPSLLSSDFSKLGVEIERMRKVGATWIHWDVMDGHFVPNLTLGPTVIRSVRPTSKLIFDVHLMIEEPEKYLTDFIEAGSDLITLHAESTRVLGDLLRKIRSHKRKCGVTLRPGTPLSSIEDFISEVDLVLVMTVEPGFGGQKFREDQIPKVQQLARWRKERKLNYLIEVDGGINLQTAALIPEADVLVAGSFLFGQKTDKDLETAFQSLQRKSFEGKGDVGRGN